MILSEVIDELVQERGLDRDVLTDIVCEGMLAAYQKKYPDLVLNIKIDKKTSQMDVLIEKDVVAQVFDDESQVSVRKARSINSEAVAGDKLWVPFDGKIGRIEVLRAKQVIASKIRQIEYAAVYNEFKDKVGTIITGTVHKCERGGAIIKLGEALAFLPKSLMIPGDKCIVGFSVRALLKEVLLEPRNDSQLVLDRASDKFLQKLFELEIPEVFEGLVEVKQIVRSPGYKSKVVVVSNDPNIDPVGTCIGVGGARIKPILKEIGGEKIDVISWSDSHELMIRGALKPAMVNRVELIDDRNAEVWVDEDQRSVAIGRSGQNISLASRLTGYNIHLMGAEPVAKSGDQEDENLDTQEPEGPQ